MLESGDVAFGVGRCERAGFRSAAICGSYSCRTLPAASSAAVAPRLCALRAENRGPASCSGP